MVVFPFQLLAIDEKYNTGYDVLPASINTAAKENSISFYRNNQMIILKPDPKGKDNKPVPFTCNIKENGDLGKPKLSKELAKLEITGTVAFDSVAGKMYYAKYNSIEKDYALYESTVEKGKWLDPVQMKIEGTVTTRGDNQFMMQAGWSYRQIGLTGFKNPSIAKGGKRIYFTATIRLKEYGNVGATDIYYIDQKADGSWGRPINAGKGVNTSTKEDYAFCDGDSVLYYSTQGKGGIDIYKSRLVNGQWSKGVSLGKDYCSGLNDFNFIGTDKMVYFVSNRNMKGKDDIYLFRKKPDPVVIPPPVPIPPEPEPAPLVIEARNWNFVLFYFDFDKHVLTPEFLKEFSSLVEEMKQFPGAKFEIAGHTDQRGSDKYNMKLSYNRANFVKDMLVKEGFPADMLIAKGFGETMPVVDDPKSEEDFAQNRRCEIRIINADSLTNVNAPAAPTKVVAKDDNPIVSPNQDAAPENAMPAPNAQPESAAPQTAPEQTVSGSTNGKLSPELMKAIQESKKRASEAKQRDQQNSSTPEGAGEGQTK